jgi:hypothetical protein
MPGGREQATVNAKRASNVSEASFKLDPHWSKLIRDDFETMNGLILDATDATVLSTLNQQSRAINALTIVIKRLERQTEILTNQVASQQVVIESQSGSLAAASVSSLKSAFSVGRNGPPMQTDIIGIQHYATSAAGVETSGSPLNRTTASPAAPDGAPDSHVPAPAPNEAVEVGLHESNPPATNAAKGVIPEVAALLITNLENELKAATTEGRTLVELSSWNVDPEATLSAGVELKQLVIALVTENNLFTRQKLYDVQPARVNKKDILWYRAVMELVEEVLTHQQRELLQLRKSEREDINNFDNVLKVAAYNIESQAFERMKALDGKTASQTKPTMTGLGGRYIQYTARKITL